MGEQIRFAQSDLSETSDFAGRICMSSAVGTIQKDDFDHGGASWNDQETYGGWLRNPAADRWFIHVYPMIYRVSTIQGGAGFLPSTV